LSIMQQFYAFPFKDKKSRFFIFERKTVALTN